MAIYEIYREDLKKKSYDAMLTGGGGDDEKSGNPSTMKDFFGKKRMDEPSRLITIH